MATAADIVTKAMRLFSILDQTESPAASDMANNVLILNDLLRSEQADGAAQYLIKRANVTLPPGSVGNIYSFSIGTADPSYLVQVDAVALRSMWINDTSPTVNRETRMGPLADVVMTTFPGIITKWHQERQADGSILITAWQPPRASAPALLSYGSRVPPITKADGSDVVTLPPEGVHDAALLLGRKIYKSYGVVMQPTDVIIVDAEAANKRWREWARGQQWLQFVRA